MILNNIEVNILSTMSLLDAYDNKFPEGFLMENVIYCVHNNVNGKNYIGQTVQVKNRFSKTYVGHFRDYDRFVSGELNETRALYRAWKKYGLESFIVYIIDIGKNHLNKLIEFLPKLRLNDNWKPEYETIFGGLTEKDRLAKKGGN